MEQKTKNALVVWAGTILGAVGGYWGASRLAATHALPLGSWGVAAGGLIGAIAGATLTKLVVEDPGAIPQFEADGA